MDLQKIVSTIFLVLILGLLAMLLLPVRARAAMFFVMPPVIGAHATTTPATSTPATLIRFTTIPALGTPKFKK